MNKQIIWSPAAEKDAEQIINFINTKWNKRVVAKFLNKLDDSVRLISENPKLFPMIEENFRRS